MVGKIERKSLAVSEPRKFTKGEKSARSHYGVSKLLTTAVSFLAASQNFGTVAAARFPSGLNVLAAPRNQSKPLGTPGIPPAGGSIGLGASIKRDNFSDKLLHADKGPSAPLWMNNAALNKTQVQLDAADKLTFSNVSLGLEATQELSSQGRGLLGNSYTWVVNDSNDEIIATTTYHCFGLAGAGSHFTNRHIAPGSKDHDKYVQETNVGSCVGDSGTGAYLDLVLGISTAHHVGTFQLLPDDSVVVQNVPGGPGLNVFKSVHGTLHQPDGQPLGQIYNN